MTDKNPQAETACLIELKLNGALERIDAKTVAEGLDLLRKLVGSLDPHGEPVKMASLRTGSTVTGVATLPAVEHALFTSIDVIRGNRVLPPNFSRKEAELLRRLAKLSRRDGVESAVLLGPTTKRSGPLDAELLESISEAIDSVPRSLGSVTGQLEGYQASERGLTAQLRDSLTHELVRVHFEENLDEAIRSNLRSNVEISGMLKRNPETNSPEEIEANSVEKIEKPTRPLPGRGIWKHLKEKGVTAEDIMRELRAEEVNSYGC